MFQESELISWLKNLQKTNNKNIAGIGDDCAIINNNLIVSTDSFVENTHFKREYFSFFDIGWKSTASAISDIAAMNGTLLYVLVSIEIPPDIPTKGIKNLFYGIEEASRQFNGTIIGGDTVRDTRLGVNITVIGRAEKIVKRTGARPGDTVYVTGRLGGSAIGFFAFRNNLNYPDAKKKHLHPLPKINALNITPHAMIDISDGLIRDAYNLSVASKVKIILNKEQIPIWHERIRNALEYALYGGEDYELLFTYDKALTDKNIFAIGYVEKGKGVFLKTENALKRIIDTGWDQFSNKSLYSI